MRGVRYITGAALADGGGMQVLQEACICKEKSQNIQLVLALVFSKRGELQRNLSIEIAEWFQNTLVPYIKKNGAESLINVCIEGLGGKNFSGRINATDYACVLLAGDNAALFKNGSTVSVYSIEELFGKAIAIPMEPGSAGIMVEPEVGGAVVLADCDMTADKFFAAQIAAGMSNASDEASLERTAREIVQIEAVACKSLVAIGFRSTEDEEV